MGAKTGIEWTDATWNPIVGCSIVSPGCTNCYAMKQAYRIERMSYRGEYREELGETINVGVSHYEGTTQLSNAGPVWTGKVALAPEHILTVPLRWNRPRHIFVNSMGDLFHESVPDEWIDQVFEIMASAPRHIFQVLTKRSKRMREYMTAVAKQASFSGQWAPPNVWLGVSAERQQEADERVSDLLATPAAVRFVSAEPLLGPINFRHMDVERTAPAGYYCIDSLTGRNSDMGRPCADVPRLDWIIVGGESGPGARPMSPHWAVSIRDQCADAGVAFFFKQWGEWAWAQPRPSGEPGRFAFGDYEHDQSLMIEVDSYPRQFTKFGARTTLERVGKRRAGRLLDGIEHNEMPRAP